MSPGTSPAPKIGGSKPSIPKPKTAPVQKIGQPLGVNPAKYNQPIESSDKPINDFGANEDNEQPVKQEKKQSKSDDQIDKAVDTLHKYKWLANFAGPEASAAVELIDKVINNAVGRFALKTSSKIYRILGLAAIFTLLFILLLVIGGISSAFGITGSMSITKVGGNGQAQQVNVADPAQMNLITELSALTGNVSAKSELVLAKIAEIKAQLEKIKKMVAEYPSPANKATADQKLSLLEQRITQLENDANSVKDKKQLTAQEKSKINKDINGDPTMAKSHPNDPQYHSLAKIIADLRKALVGESGNGKTFSIDGATYMIPIRNNPKLSPYYFQDDKNKPDIGLDMWATKGTDIYGARDGTVTRVTGNYDNEGSRTNGYRVTVTHSDKTESVYKHLVSTPLKIGDKVTTSTLIGKVGVANNAPHLHFEIWRYSKSHGRVYCNPFYMANQIDGSNRTYTGKWMTYTGDYDPSYPADDN